MPLFLRVLTAENIKLRRTLALWVTVLAPLVVCVLDLFIYLSRFQDMQAMQMELTNAWDSLARQALMLWVVLTLVPFISLETALVSNLEHGQSTLKALFVQPAPRWMIYLAKLAAGAVLLLLGMLALVVGTLLSGVILEAAFPGGGYKFQSFPWDELVRPALNAYVLALAAVTLHTWIGMRFRSFVVTLGIGIVATVFNFLVIMSQKGQQMGWWLPWALPLNTLDGMSPGHLQDGLLISLGLAAGLALFGCWEISRRDIY